MKIILGIIVVIFSTCLGYIFSTKYKLKSIYYTSFYNFNKLLKNEVSFTKKTIIEIIDSIKESNIFYDNLKNIFKIKNYKIENKSLNNDEIEFLHSYIDRIGQTEAKTELDYLSSIELVLKEKMDEVVAIEKKYKPLCIKMGFLLGLIIFVLIV